MNRLSQEISPYLLQHQHNPVDWYPWGAEALEKARREDKPIFLSIGYATCHWCHVMEGDSFEKEDVAAVLNRHYVAIKVDREERPDIDAIYMKAVQAMNQRGGWPLSVMLTPDGKPFWGGTFFPREQFKDILEQIAQIWLKRRADIDDNAAELNAHLAQLSQRFKSPEHVDLQPIESFTANELAAFDPEWGGFGGAPKFPPSMALLTLMRQQQRQPDPALLQAIEGTLDGMARGGMRDHVGGGFHRYSVDETWLLPHFEKMLYDNALLTIAYSEAYQLTKKEDYREVVATTIDYILRDMQSPEGGFYAAEDADSEKTEGKFYVWKMEELRDRLSPSELQLALKYFELKENGNFTIDRRVEELEAAAGLKAVHAANILHHQKAQALPSRRDPEYKALLDKLFALRSERVRPGLDDKILCAWNGLMIGALSKAHQTFGEARFLQAAETAASFILKNLRSEGKLLRSYRQGSARHAAYLEDYSSLIFGLIELYQASFEARWLEEALALQAQQDFLFWDENDGSYFETDGSDKTLLMRSKEWGDHATPSGNSLSAYNLFRLGGLTGTGSWSEKGEKILERSAGILNKYPAMLTMMLVALDFARSQSSELVISSQDRSRFAWPQLYPAFSPHTVFLRAEKRLLASCPSLLGKVEASDPSYFFCEKGSCRRPVFDHQEALQQLYVSYAPHAN